MAQKQRKTVDYWSEFKTMLKRSYAEILNSATEGKIERAELPKIAEVVVNWLKKHKITDLELFDRNFSLIIGKSFDEIEYKSDAVREKRRKIFEKMGIPDFKTAESIKKYLEKSAVKRVEKYKKRDRQSAVPKESSIKRIVPRKRV